MEIVNAMYSTHFVQNSVEYRVIKGLHHGQHWHQEPAHECSSRWSTSSGQWQTNDESLGSKTELSIDCIMEILTLCLKMMYFMYEDKFTNQFKGREVKWTNPHKYQYGGKAFSGFVKVSTTCQWLFSASSAISNLSWYFKAHTQGNKHFIVR